MDRNRQHDILLIACITVSLLLHLLLVKLLPARLFTPPPVQTQPVLVEMQPVNQFKDRELNLPPRPAPKKPRTTPAKRLAAQDHVVKRETAPKGRDTEDRTPSAASRPTPAPSSPRTKPRPRPTPRVKTASPAQPTPERRFQAEKAPAEARRPTAPKPATPAPLPNLNTLTRLAPQTVARLEQDWRRKYRKDVAEGNAVWLDTEKDILISFFRRFKDNIYNVWNYPPDAADRGEEGKCLLKITVNHDGTVARVQLMESSGFATLDRAAILAVRRGAPYGELPKSYKHKVLNIFAVFRYDVFHTSRFLY